MTDQTPVDAVFEPAPRPWHEVQQAANLLLGGEYSGPGGEARAWEAAGRWRRTAQIEHAANELLLEKLDRAERELKEHKAALEGSNAFLAELAQLRLVARAAKVWGIHCRAKHKLEESGGPAWELKLKKEELRRRSLELLEALDGLPAPALEAPPEPVDCEHQAFLAKLEDGQ